MWWFIYGLLVGAGGMRLIISAQAGSLQVGWYVWPILAAAVALCAMTLQHFFASLDEMEPKAAWLGLLFMGIPSLFLFGLAAWLI